MARSVIVYRRAQSEAGSDDLVALDRASFEVMGVVCEERGPHRDGLAEALGRIAAGDASTLVVARLSDLASSLPGLFALLDWFGAEQADVVALDVGLDTGTVSGQGVLAVLREIKRWEREPEPGRHPRGRPGLAAQAPELSARIAVMRKDGMSLQAIADALNADGVPTRRGGTHWRPSSVQAALGYRRPPAPIPVTPPHLTADKQSPPPPPGGPRRTPPGRGRP